MNRNNCEPKYQPSNINIRYTNTLICMINANQQPYQAGHALQNGPHTHI